MSYFRGHYPIIVKLENGCQNDRNGVVGDDSDDVHNDDTDADSNSHDDNNDRTIYKVS